MQEYQLVPEVVVTLQECKGSDCIVISKTIDTSAIAKAQPQIENTNNETGDNAPVAPLTAADLVRFRWSGGNCQGEGSRNFEVSPIDPADIDWIKPLGHLTGVHVTPTSHQKIYPFAGRTVDVRAPISGRIIYLTNRGNANTGASFGGSSNQGYEVQYVIEVSCDFYLIIDHVLGVPDLIAQELGSSWDKSVNIPISAGDLLGQHTDGSKIDIGVIDLTRGVVPGLLLQESYFDGQDGEPFKFFERDSFEYFDEPLRSEIADKSIRIVEPRGGRFDYDIDGTARGNWFQEGTNGYRGTTSDNFGNYWSGHLALIEDSTEPSKLRVSVGDGFANAESAIWGVTGDGPRFETITTASGQTSYELRRLLPCDGSSLNQPGKAREFLCNQEAVGILLIELIDEWTLLVEIFFQSSNTYGVVFSENVRTYIR